MKRALAVTALSILVCLSSFAQSWQQEFVAGVEPEIITAYQALGAQSGPGRRATVEAMSPELKAGLWKMNLAMFVAGNPQLTAEQRTAIEDVAALLTPELYDLKTRDAARGPIDARIAHAKQVLTPEMVRDSMRLLGGPIDPNAVSTTAEPCNCSPIHPPVSCPVEHCTIRTCARTSWGCGEVGMNQCYRMCQEFAE